MINAFRDPTWIKRLKGKRAGIARQYVKGKLTVDEIARRNDTTPGYVEKCMSELRSKGYPIPDRRIGLPPLVPSFESENNSSNGEQDQTQENTHPINASKKKPKKNGAVLAYICFQKKLDDIQTAIKINEPLPNVALYRADWLRAQGHDSLATALGSYSDKEVQNLVSFMKQFNGEALTIPDALSIIKEGKSLRAEIQHLREDKQVIEKSCANIQAENKLLEDMTKSLEKQVEEKESFIDNYNRQIVALKEKVNSVQQQLVSYGNARFLMQEFLKGTTEEAGKKVGSIVQSRINKLLDPEWNYGNILAPALIDFFRSNALLREKLGNLESFEDMGNIKEMQELIRFINSNFLNHMRQTIDNAASITSDDLRVITEIVE